MIKELLNSLSPVDVLDIHFDIRGSKIRVDLKDERTIQFEEVISFFYTDEEYSYLHSNELKPIVYKSGGIETITYFGDDDEPYAIPNISLCTYDRSMLIEAKKIQINGNTYDLDAIEN